MQRMNNARLKTWPAFAAMVVAAAMVSFVLAQGSSTKADDSKDKEKIEVKAELNAEALKAIMDAKVPILLLDARGPSDQWIDGAVPLAHNADEKAIRQAVGNPNRLIVTYCGGPECPMSLMLANNLAEHGYTHVIRFTGGVEAWTEAGFKMAEKEKPKGSNSKKPSGSSTR